MATTFDALLRIKADVQGEGAVQNLATKLGGLQATAGKVSQSFRGMAGAAGGLLPGLQALVPLATGAGLTAMAASAINAADNMRDMSQRTGVSVERLSQLQQAAEKSGTTIEGVANALTKYNRGIVDGKAAKALNELGISSTDATGKLKSADAVLLEVADRFATMPDGAEKTAAAIKLFGRSGAELIPLLNGGSESIKGLAVTMTGEFAGAADEFNDRMVELRTGLSRLGVDIGAALLPSLTALTGVLVGALQTFRELPGPVQVLTGAVTLLVLAWGPLVGIIANTIVVGKALAALQLGATIAGWAGAIGPAVGAMTVALSGFLAFLTGTFVPTLVAIFSGPVGWTVLAVAAVVAMAVAFREPIMGFLSWLGGALVQGFTAAWELAKGPVVAMGQWLGQRYEEFSELFRSRVVAPILSAWNAVTTAIPNAMRSAAETVQGIWTGVMNGIRSVVNGVLSSIVGGVNSAVAGVNRLIGSFNALPGPDVPFVPTLGIPQFARGGYVNRPTLAMIGEGGEGEYVVPESQVDGFARRVMAGQRGSNTIRPYGRYEELDRRLAAAQQRGDFRNLSTEGERVKRGQIARSLGFIPGAGSMPFTLRPGATASGGARGGGSVSVSVNTRVDRVIRQDGEDRVTLGQAQQMASDAARQAVAQMTQKLRQPSYRREVGIR